jgi:hypothetical protein
MHAAFWWGNLRVRDHFEDIAAYGRIILKLTLTIEDGRNWTALI